MLNNELANRTKFAKAQQSGIANTSILRNTSRIIGDPTPMTYFYDIESIASRSSLEVRAA